MNFKDDETGVVHEGRYNSNPEEGRTLCGKNWVTFSPHLYKKETESDVDCMACIASGVSE